MGTRIAAIALLTLRTALRSRLVVSLLVLLTIVIGGLPLLVKGDGTVEGLVELLLSYTLGLATLILMTTTLWTSCGSISGDIQTRRIQLLAVKPLRKGELWIGKWLGIVFLNGCLLGLCGVGTYTLLSWRLASLNLTPDARTELEQRTLSGNLRLSLNTRDVEEEAVARWKAAVAQDWPGKDLPAEVGQAIMRKRILVEDSAVAAGATRQWRIEVPESVDPDSGKMLRIQLAPPLADVGPATGFWTIEGSDGRRVRVESSPLHYGVSKLALPDDLIAPGTPAVIRFTNTRPAGGSAIVFDPERGLELLSRETGLIANGLRAFVVLLAQLAAVAAIGLTAGSLLSFPVSVFLTSSLICMALLGNSFTSAPEEAYGITAEVRDRGTLLDSLETFGRAFMKVFSHISGPLVAANPLPEIAEGSLVPSADVRRVTLTCLLLYTAVLGGLSVFVLQRRELAGRS